MKHRILVALALLLALPAPRLAAQSSTVPLKSPVQKVNTAGATQGDVDTGFNLTATTPVVVKSGATLTNNGTIANAGTLSTTGNLTIASGGTLNAVAGSNVILAGTTTLSGNITSNGTLTGGTLANVTASNLTVSGSLGGTPSSGTLNLSAVALTVGSATATSLTAPSSTNLTISGGSGGAGAFFGNGANGNITLTPQGTGGVNFVSSTQAAYRTSQVYPIAALPSFVVEGRGLFIYDDSTLTQAGTVQSYLGVGTRGGVGHGGYASIFLVDADAPSSSQSWEFDMAGADGKLYLRQLNSSAQATGTQLVVGTDGGLTLNSTTSGTSPTAAAIVAKSLGLSENLRVQGLIEASGAITGASVAAPSISSTSTLSAVAANVTTSLNVGNTINSTRLAQRANFANAGGNWGGIALTTWSTTSNEAPLLDINRSKGSSGGTYTAVANGDWLGAVIFRGSDGSAFQSGAYILGTATATATSGHVPAKMEFFASSATTQDNLVMALSASGSSGSGVVNIPGTTSATSSTAGALTVGGGSAATNVAIGGGNINAGGNITVGGTQNVFGLPSSANALSTNSTMTFERTSDTQLTIKVRGADGTTRSVALTLAP